MVDTLYLKSLLINSPCEGFVRLARKAAEIPRRRSHPELTELFLEGDRVPLILSRLLKPDSNAIDIGCHIGSFLRQLLALAPRGNHVAIEPSPTKAALLRRRFPRVRIEEVAISDYVGVSAFEENLDRSGFSKLADAWPSMDRVKSYQVNVTSLDAMDLPGRFDFVKIDIEGNELATFRGGRKFFETHRPNVLFECGSDYHEGLDRRSLYEEISSKGYDIFTFTDFLFEKGPLGFDEFRKCGLYPFRAFNFLAILRN
jgi:FkbM family methyltransferase